MWRVHMAQCGRAEGRLLVYISDKSDSESEEEEQEEDLILDGHHKDDKDNEVTPKPSCPHCVCNAPGKYWTILNGR